MENHTALQNYSDWKKIITEQRSEHFRNILQNILIKSIKNDWLFDSENDWQSLITQDNTIVKALKTIVSEYLEPVGVFSPRFNLIYSNTNLISNATKQTELNKFTKNTYL